MSENFYDILGVERKATEAEIKAAYRKQALKWHPDKNGNSEEAKKKFQEILKAYEILVDPITRSEYNKDDSVNSSTRRTFKPSFNYNYREEAYKSIESILDEMFWAIKEMDLDNIFGHRRCLSCVGINSSFNFFNHIYFCLENRDQVDNFVTRFLAAIENYANELKTFKEEAICRVKEHLESNHLSFYAKKAFEKERVICGHVYKNWQEVILSHVCKKRVSFSENNFKDFIDKVSDGKQSNKNSKPQVKKSVAEQEQFINSELSQLNQRLLECQRQQKPQSYETFSSSENIQEESSFPNDNNQNTSTQTPEQQVGNKKKNKNQDKNKKGKENQSTTETPPKSKNNDFPTKLIISGGVLIVFSTLVISVTFSQTKNKLLRRK